MAFSKRSRRQEEETVTTNHDHIYSNSVSHDSTEASCEAQAEGNSTVALPCEICGELCPSDRLMKRQEGCSQESESTVDPTASRREENLYGSNLPLPVFER